MYIYSTDKCNFYSIVYYSSSAPSASYEPETINQKENQTTSADMKNYSSNNSSKPYAYREQYVREKYLLLEDRMTFAEMEVNEHCELFYIIFI
jgi:hypothetical protein